MSAFGTINSGTELLTQQIGILSTTNSIDGTVATTTNLYTVPTGKTAIVTGAIIRITTATAITIIGTGGIGIAAGEADIFPAIVFTALDGTGKAFMLSNTNLIQVVGNSTEVIKLGIDVGYTATTATLSVSLLGFLI